MKKGRLPQPPSEGFSLEYFVQDAPLLFTDSSLPAFLGDMYRGRPAFLVGGGPSFALVDHAELRRPGCVAMAMNNAVRTFRSDLWVGLDHPEHFLRSIWLDSRIMKFTPLEHARARLFDNENWEPMEKTVAECPNVFYFMRNSEFSPESFLHESTVNWGSSREKGGGRSVMLAALRILFFLGFRHVFLLGVDFRMSPQLKYHFPEERSEEAIRVNNSLYRTLTERLELLRPEFEEAGFHVYNCNPESALEVFPHIPFEEAVAFSTAGFPQILEDERSFGLYGREAGSGRAADSGSSADLEDSARNVAEGD